MKIKSIKYFPFTLSLKKSLHTSKIVITERKGIIIRIEDSGGIISYGESTPLEQFGSESYSAMIGQLPNTINALQKNAIEYDIDYIDELLSKINIYPSLRHGIEQAIIFNWLKKDAQDFFSAVNRTRLNVINISGLVTISSVSDTIKSIRELIHSGYRTIKIKIGTDFNKEREILSQLYDTFGEMAHIRLDVNGAWSFKEAEKYLNLLSRFQIQYIEQPVSNIDDLISLSKISPIPIAADESIRSVSNAQRIIEESSIKFFVIKPMMIGGLINTLKILSLAEKKQNHIIISSSFESAVARNFLVLIVTLIKNNFAHGIGASEYFRKDFGKERFTFENGSVYVEDNIIDCSLGLEKYFVQ